MYLICGEALYDMFQTGASDGGLAFDARPGGSPFNVAIGVARLGGRAALLTGLSTDRLGQGLADLLAAEGVGDDYLIRSGRRTTLSVVALRPDGVPDYAFYGVGSADCSVTVADLPVIGDEVQALHFGSYSLVVEPVADAFAALAERAGRFVSLDPNVRPTVEPDMARWRERIDAMRGRAGLIKVSDEDLGHLYPSDKPEEIAATWAGAGATVVLTRGPQPALAWHQGATLTATPIHAEVADTVGAGDSFMACLLNGVAGAIRGDRLAIGAEAFGAILDRATRAAAITVSRTGADLPRAADLDRAP